MNIEFVNHSSIIIKHNGNNIICDPWIEGSVFNKGWSLITPSKFTFEDFKNIDHIWFSHEHPDHFFPPNIKKIPAEYRKNITVLFQYTIDKRVLNFCNDLGFKKVIELKKDQWYNINSDLKVLCEHYQEGDSWICFKSKDRTLLNTNDCGIRNLYSAKQIKNKVGKVDVLLTQFSYAYWVGNPDQKHLREKKANDKLSWLKFQVEIFQPSITIPMASFVYFSHVENFWMNDSVNTPSKVYNYIKDKTNSLPILLFPGDVYIPYKEHNSEISLQKFEEEYAKNIKLENCTPSISVEFETLKITQSILLKF
jgi:L-ascorbate metabolism protein UlaG (beta-lactamase superfamily)